MKIHRFHVTVPLTTGILRIENDALAHQLRSVLKIKSGETIEIFNSEGQSAEATLVDFEKNTVVVEVKKVSMRENKSIHATLYLALLKGEHFEMAIEKCTELGVVEIVPLITDRTIKNGLRRERLERIIKEAVEQSGQVRIPTLHDSISFAEALTSRDREMKHILFDPTGDKIPHEIVGARRALWIGPEGGWTEKELDLARKENIPIHSLGQTILRAETAAIVGAYSVLQI